MMSLGIEEDGKDAHETGRDTLKSEFLADCEKSRKKHHSKRKKDDLLDDFFAIGDTSVKKKKKKAKSHGDLEGLERVESTSKTKLENLKAGGEVFDEGIGSRSLPVDTSTDNYGESVEVVEVVKEVGRNDGDENRGRRSITPPIFDREAIVATRMGAKKPASRDTQSSLEIHDDGIDDDDELELFGSARPSFSSAKSSQNSKGYQFTEENEKKRVYIIKVVSKVVPGTDLKADFGTKGTKRFDKILNSVVTHFQVISKSVRSIKEKYNENNVALVWVDGRMELKPFFKPSTLRVLPKATTLSFGECISSFQPTILNCLLIPRENLLTFGEVYPEFETNARSMKKIAALAEEIEQIGRKEQDKQEELDTLAASEDEAVFESFLGDLESTSKVEIIDSEDESYFIIGLKGQDNKRHEVQVSSDTKITSLLLYYLKKKDIDESTFDLSKAKLIFDDEILALNGKVGDTELEDGDEVQVVI